MKFRPEYSVPGRSRNCDCLLRVHIFQQLEARERAFPRALSLLRMDSGWSEEASKALVSNVIGVYRD